MQTLQQKVMKKIEDLVTLSKLECADTGSAVNCGKIYVTQPNKFKTILTISYYFQSDSCNLGINTEKELRVSYSDCEKLDGFFSSLANKISSVK